MFKTGKNKSWLLFNKEIIVEFPDSYWKASLFARYNTTKLVIGLPEYNPPVIRTKDFL